MVTDGLKQLVKKSLAPFGHYDRYEYLGLALEFESWRKANPPIRFYQSRNLLYRDVNAEVLGNSPVDYLEFGVWKGDTIRYWTEINKDARSRFYGFDSFEGLPEPWGDYPKGHFSTGGRIPLIDDPRAAFVKGWFQETLPGFLEQFETRNRLVLHLDADLYSATLFILSSMNRLLVPGTVLIFDEFNDFLHEYRALRDYTASFLRKYRPLFYTDTYKQVAVVLE